MIPQFPAFRDLLLGDRQQIEKLTYDFRHYSDYQFTSLWAWNLDNSIQVSVLNGSLILKMRDYLSGEPYFSFCGNKKPDDTCFKLLELAEQEGLDPVLKYIPDVMAKEITKNKLLKVTEDRNNFDYVLPIKKALAADDKKSRRKYLRQFEKRYAPIRVKQIDVSDKDNQKLIIKSATDWTMKKDGNPDQLENEIPAMERLITDLDSAIVVLGVFSDNKLIGFSIEEIVDKEFATGHFQRVDHDYRRCFLYLNHALNQQLLEKGLKFINIQQDAGDLELRKTKEEKYPFAEYIKKYQIKLAS